MCPMCSGKNAPECQWEADKVPVRISPTNKQEDICACMM